MRRRGKSGVALLALVGCSATGLALGGCSGDSDSSSASARASASVGGYSDVVQVTGRSTLTSGITWTTEASDPRVSGVYRNDHDCEMIDDGDRTTGFCPVVSTITNDEGSWEGGCTGTTTWTVTEPEHIHDFDCVMVGAGGHLGLRFRYHVWGGDAMPWEFTGQIETFPESSSWSS